MRTSSCHISILDFDAIMEENDNMVGNVVNRLVQQVAQAVSGDQPSHYKGSTDLQYERVPLAYRHLVISSKL